MVALAEEGIRTYISEPDRGIRRWKGDDESQQAVYANRRRIKGERGRALLRTRGELLERPFAHLYETGGMRRTHLRGHTNILKRLLVHVSGFNLGLLMRSVFGVGTPRSLQGRMEAVLTAFSDALLALLGLLRVTSDSNRSSDGPRRPAAWWRPLPNQSALAA